MKIFTIGFTNKKAQAFFEKLRGAGVKRVVDVRLNNVSQLAGFSSTFCRRSLELTTSTFQILRPHSNSSTPTKSTREIGLYTKRSFSTSWEDVGLTPRSQRT